jgi:hypothetical protein
MTSAMMGGGIGQVEIGRGSLRPAVTVEAEREWFGGGVPMMTVALMVGSGRRDLLQHRGSRVRVRRTEIEVGGGRKVELITSGDGDGGGSKFSMGSGAPITDGG